jgi:hypothetical protein
MEEAVVDHSVVVAEEEVVDTDPDEEAQEEDIVEVVVMTEEIVLLLQEVVDMLVVAKDHLREVRTTMMKDLKDRLLEERKEVLPDRLPTKDQVIHRHHRIQEMKAEVDREDILVEVAKDHLVDIVKAVEVEVEDATSIKNEDRNREVANEEGAGDKNHIRRANHDKRQSIFTERKDLVFIHKKK